MSLNQPLIEIASIAIWNKNKVVMAAAISVWCINVGFLIKGRSLFSFPAVTWGDYTNVVW
jgi:hypothetical protein